MSDSFGTVWTVSLQFVKTTHALQVHSSLRNANQQLQVSHVRHSLASCFYFQNPHKLHGHSALLPVDASIHIHINEIALRAAYT